MPADSMLLVANYGSNVGYAWWLMESFWAALGKRYASQFRVLLAFPSIGVIPEAIQRAPIEPLAMDFTRRDLTSVLSQLEFIRRQRVRAIYFTDQSAIDWRYAAFHASGVRHVVVHDHTPGNRDIPQGLKRFAKVAMHRMPLAVVDAMIGATPYVTERHRLVNCLPRERCFTVANGIPVIEAVLAQSPHDRFGIPAHQHILVTLGRANEVKSLETAIEAVSILRHEHGRDDVCLLLCGDGPALSSLQALATRMRVNDVVRFAGRQERVREFLGGCTIGLHPSTMEVGYSLSILEMMEAGLPVIVTDDPSVRGATVDRVNGMLATTRDSRCWAERIRELLDDPALRAQLGSAARASVEAEFRLSGSHRALLAAFDQIIPRREGLH